MKSPAWKKIEPTARAICASSIDGTCSFEELSEAANLSIQDIKNIVYQAWKNEEPIQLAHGEIRDLRYPEQSGLDIMGERWYRFLFLE
jgi:hypothetical protein